MIRNFVPEPACPTSNFCRFPATRILDAISPSSGMPRYFASRFSVPSGNGQAGTPGNRLATSVNVPSPPAATIPTSTARRSGSFNRAARSSRREKICGRRSWRFNAEARSKRNRRRFPLPERGFRWMATHGRITSTVLAARAANESRCVEFLNHRQRDRAGVFGQSRPHSYRQTKLLQRHSPIRHRPSESAQ